jgi:hypothetical protein
MAIVYEKAEVADKLIVAVMEKSYGDLVAADVTVECLFANAGKYKDGTPKPAVKIGGVKTAVKVRVCTQEMRAAGSADARVIIDELMWDEMEQPERKALLDHALHHLQVIEEKPEKKKKKRKKATTNEDGEPLPDPPQNDYPPKLQASMRKPDWKIWGFMEVVKRHGAAAMETKQVEDFKDKWGQLFLWAQAPAEVG